jgi:hypothetical protein
MLLFVIIILTYDYAIICVQQLTLVTLVMSNHNLHNSYY